MDLIHNCMILGPISLDLIEKNLYLGSLSAALDGPTLSKCEITHILTIDTCPLPRRILENKNFVTKFIPLTDQPKEDLLSHFDVALDFIEDGLKNGVVFVHCYFGISRSASVITAYIMRKYQLRYDEALQKVKSRRSMVHPNKGFLSQLKLFQEMGYRVDKDCMSFKIFRLTIAADKVKKIKILPTDYTDLIKSDPGKTQTQPEPNVYRCRKCRRILATESNLIVHKDKASDQPFCTKIYFVEPIAWMSDISLAAQSKLFCPKCKNKVGSFSWLMGCQCPCGCLVAPAFYLLPSKVDWSNVVKNVEVTV